MRMLSESGPAPFRSWLFSTLALLFLAGCATTRLAEEDQPTTAAALDVGYGTINQDHLVGSVATVYSEEGQLARPRTMAEMLARVPGVVVKNSPTQGVIVQIRGGGALYVVDGMIFHGSLNSLNPNFVESITVLKNPGETAIYGSRAAHGGVILIRTKGGSK